MKHSTINQIIMWIAMLRGLVDMCSVDGGGAAPEPTISYTTTHNNTQQQQSLAPGTGICVFCYFNLMLTDSDNNKLINE
jgi:hypothetical protein